MRFKSSAWASVAIAAALVGVLVVPGSAATQDGTEAAVDAALSWLQQNHGDFGLSAGDVAEVRVTDAYRSQHNGVTHVYLRQQRDGVDVSGGSMTINVEADHDVVYAGSHFVPEVAEAVSGEVVVDAVRAVQAAARALGVGATTGLRVLASASTPARETLLSDGGISRRPIQAKLVYQALDDGTAPLAWNFDIEERSAQHWWSASVDARTGRLIASVDLVDHDNIDATAAAIARPASGAEEGAAATQEGQGADAAAYRVYQLPNETPNEGDRVLVANPADPVTSPFGWHDTNGQPGAESTLTKGNNANAYTDTHNGNAPLAGTQPDGGAALQFDFPLDTRLPPPAYAQAAVTNLFYVGNVIHDVFARYGFDEVAGNFQVTNYTGEGLGNDDAQLEAQDGSGTNNANFATPADGSKPRMQMYLWTPAAAANTNNAQIRDGDLDAGIITHEYGHGISNRLTGGPNTSGCLGHQEREGEGWSDWLAVALTAKASDAGKSRGVGTYALFQADRHAKGIRTTPYSQDMAVNPSTYDSIKTAAVPHGVGYVWATMLWEVYWDLVAEHGFNPDVYGDWTTGGNNLAIQLVMDGMKMQVCSPGFAESRDAILAADLALTGGANQCIIWRGFAKRGLGVSADQGTFNNRADGTQEFDLPQECSAA